MNPRWRLAAIVGAVCLAGTPARADRSVDAAAAMGRGEYAKAETLYALEVKDHPTDKFAVYNLACARAMGGKIDDAVETLLDALSLGFVDFFHMDRDETLDPIKGTDRYKAIVDNWARLLNARFDAEEKAIRAALGDEYLIQRDDRLRLGFEAAIDERDLEAVRAEASRVWGFAGSIIPVASPDAARPDPWVHVVLPTMRDFARLIRGEVHVGGYYDRDDKRLVARDLGPSLRHELFHVAHWRHMDRIGQVHAIWIQEGLASLVEDVDIAPNGAFEIRPSWRTNIAKRLAEASRLMPLAQFAALDHDRFVTSRPRAMYAEARAWMLMLHQRGVLPAWYADYVAHYSEDPTGAASVARALGVEPKDVDAEIRRWLRGLEEVGEIARPGAASLGLALAQGDGAGPVVDELVGTRPTGVGGSGESRLRYRDVILEVDGKAVRTLDDLFRIMGEHEVGDEVKVRIRRGTLEREVTVTLVPYDPDTGR